MNGKNKIYMKEWLKIREMSLEPILKWAGGKRSLISEIMALFPPDYRARRYHEPFFGGGAVFFKIMPKSGTINDINNRLMNFYTVVRDHPEKLIEMANQYKHDKETYYKLRDRFNQPGLSNIKDASLLLYLNKTAYNGLYRVNSSGGFNVPFGRYKNPNIVPEERIRAVSRILKNVKIYNNDFSYVVDYAEKGDLCYFDPPYQPVSSTANFTSYSSDGFDFTDQIRLCKTCLDLDSNGVYFILSNSFVSEIIDLYIDIDSFRVEVVQANRAISSKVSTRGPIYEILVTNIPKEISIGDIVIQYRFKRLKKESNFDNIIKFTPK